MKCCCLRGSLLAWSLSPSLATLNAVPMDVKGTQHGLTCGGGSLEHTVPAFAEDMLAPSRRSSLVDGQELTFFCKSCRSENVMDLPYWHWGQV